MPHFRLKVTGWKGEPFQQMEELTEKIGRDGLGEVSICHRNC
jgi:hypothetical protein